MTHSRCGRWLFGGQRGAVVMLLSLLTGCGTLPGGPDPSGTATAPPEDGAKAITGAPEAQARPDGTSAAAPMADANDVVLTALALIGVPYLFASDDPARGFDCSGLVRHVFRTSLNLELPRSSEQMAARGVPTNSAELRAGDLVFFNTLGRRHSHVGIYIGDRQFVHAPTTRGAVRIDLMDTAYWRSHFDGARRLLAPARATGGAP